MIINQIIVEQMQYQFISNRIRLRRLELEFSQEYMAERLNISQNTYSRNEKNIKDVPLNRVMHIAELLNLDIVKLLEK